MRVLGPLMGGGYDAAAARDAKYRIRAFFDRHLKTDDANSSPPPDAPIK